MNKLQITLLSFLGIATACTNNIDETITVPTGKPVIVQASIGEAKAGRADLATTDGLSYTKFNTTPSADGIGLFAGGGLSANNSKLTYNGNTFTSEELNWLGGNATNIWAYYPYSEDQNSGMDNTQINIWRTSTDGFDDILTTKPVEAAEGTTISATFSHRFALVVIKRGEGFDATGLGSDQKDVTVSLNQAIGTTATITSNTPIQFITGDKQELTTKTVGDNYYVIIPVGILDGSNVGIQSIKLYNQLGKETIVPYSKDFESGKQYTVTVKMLNNTAVVSPTEIVQWDNEQVAIDDPAGITQANFNDWVGAYNDQGANSDATLNACGKYNETEKKWTFYLKEDIDISTLTSAAGSGFHGITEFKDIFDGQGHTISNIDTEEAKANSDYTGFVRTLKGGAEIKRLILKDAVVYGTENVGAFAGKAETGSKISNCKLTGASIIYGTKASSVGTFVGYNEGSIDLSTCTAAPTVIVKVGK